MSVELQRAYAWVRESRNALLAYCASLPNAVYTQVHRDFGRGSLRNLHVHVHRAWDEVDALVEQFFQRHGENLAVNISGAVPWQTGPATLTPLWLLTHTITHEFHHKGQMVTLGRHLGYPPPDIDLAPPRP